MKLHTSFLREESDSIILIEFTQIIDGIMGRGVHRTSSLEVYDKRLSSCSYFSREIGETANII